MQGSLVQQYYTLLIKFFVEVEKQELRGTDEAIEIEKVYRQRRGPEDDTEHNHVVVDIIMEDDTNEEEETTSFININKGKLSSNISPFRISE